MIILGIDPGSVKAGYALIALEGRKAKYLCSGVMKYAQVDVFMNRLGHIYRSCEELLERYQPDEIAIESLIHVKNVNSLAKLSQARGAMIAAFMQSHQERVFEYSPNLIKSSVTGHGHAVKESVDKALAMIFGRIEFQTHDESDALAIALCHALMRDNPMVGQKQQHHNKGRSLSDVFRAKGRLK